MAFSVGQNGQQLTWEINPTLGGLNSTVTATLSVPILATNTRLIAATADKVVQEYPT